MKLNRFKEKSARYESHKDFLSSCITEKLIPKGLKLQLEPTIGNYDQEFLDKWYARLDNFSIILMKEIVEFCNKTIKESNDTIKETEATSGLPPNFEFKIQAFFKLFSSFFFIFQAFFRYKVLVYLSEGIV